MTSPATADQIDQWNREGRAFISKITGLIANVEEGGEDTEEWPTEPRGEDQARAIIAAVEAAERSGQWVEDAPVADRAHEPLVPLFEGTAQNLRCASILGPDELLICPGSGWQPGTTLHLNGGKVTERPEILAAKMTRSHDLLLLVTAEGFAVTTGLDAAVLRRFPWPDEVEPTALEDLHLAEDGLTLLFTHGDHEVWLGQWSEDTAHWTCVYPDAAFLEEIDDEVNEDDEEDFEWSDSMMHSALSPDGRFIAFGSQCYGHFISRIDGIGDVRRFAKIGHRSEYPHNACFSDDSAHAALNSCHFYRGATLGVQLDQIEGADTPEYEDDPRVTELDDHLRVYASTWLPDIGGQGVFALAGSSYLNMRGLDGAMRASLYFGSSASSIDYCPKTGQLAVGSYSGFLHLYDPKRVAEPGTVIGYKPFHERYRWVIWQNRAPFRW